MKTYTFRFREIERVKWNETKGVKDEIVTGTLPELRKIFGVNEIERISWASPKEEFGTPTKISTPQRLERFFNRKNRVGGKFIVYIKG